MYRKLILLITLTNLAFNGFSQFPTDPRSDSLDITHQHVNLTITDFVNKTISGSTEIKYRAITNNVAGIYLDLHEFTIDSIKISGASVPYTYNDSLIKIPFQTSMSLNDSAKVTVWYHGLAQQGSGGWGGFYWAQGIAFNMGVTLYDVPHNAGRFWFPCFDNFTEKALYDVTITTQNTHAAICGGTLISQVTNPNLTKTWHWKLNSKVPSYLVSVAVGGFAFVTSSYNAQNGSIPVILAALPSDTTSMKSSFQNLHNAFNIYEQFYGPYLWERVGYVLVPFNGGAMEHATNIAYQKTLVDGNTTYESVMAHELSHHWWGDLITCQTAEDMWMNEGMAVFSEYLFIEQMYGRPQAISTIRSSHNSVIKTAHVTDGTYQPLSGMPQEFTYGKHTYDKGGNVAWSLRGYMGDSLFFKGLRAVLNRYEFDNLNAPMFRNIITDSTGYDVEPFFNDWIQQPGFAEFLLDSFSVTPTGNQFTVSVSTSQRLRAANHLYTEVPLELTFIAANRTKTVRRHIHSGAFTSADFVIPFEPAAVFINRDEKLFYAVTADEREIKTVSNVSLSYSNFKLNTTTISDSALVRSEYHWAAPDNNVDHFWKYELTPDRFWNIDGIFPAGFRAVGTFAFDGSANGPDNPIIYAEDSVVLFYRSNGGAAWAPADSFTINTQIAGDKKGNITTPIKKGQYCIGTKKATVSISDLSNTKNAFSIYPNPTDGAFGIRFVDGTSANCNVEIYDNLGKLLFKNKLNSTNTIDVRNLLSSGTYRVKVISGTEVIGTTSLVIKK